ncbi:unnamed protein product [Camellia sinensis]
MTEHWNKFIVEDDFNFISSNGINAVRIPVGWWIASDPTPPQPYVGGSLQALDNVFIWAQKDGINVIIDLHAAPDSQNGYEHSSSRDGSQEWGLSDQNIQQTVNVIDFLTSRYANNPSLYAVELMNEPLSPGASLNSLNKYIASLDSLNKYYSAGYNVVRKYSSTAYVIMSNRLGAIDPQELFPIASSLEGGEWVAEWKVGGVAKKDYQRFGKAQLEVYGRASFGWAYWTLKNVNNHWSLKWMISNGLWRINESNFHFRLRNKKFMGLQSSKKGSYIVPVSKESDRSETFQIMKYNHRSTRIRIKAPNGFFLQVNKEGHVTADSKGSGGWRDDDPSVFEMKIGRQFDGEFQVTNVYGKLAPKVMREHWNTFITEDDFKFMSSNGINTENSSGVVDSFRSNTPSAIRWRILKSLGQCLLVGTKYGMKVIIDLHAAPGSQTNSAVSSSRDGFVEWGQTDQNIQETVDVIDFLTVRYAKHPSLYAVELLNGPCAPCVTLEKLKKYYRAGYNAVRKHSSTAYVIMASRMQYGMKPVDPTELFPLARELKGSAIDVHYYQIFTPVFKKMNHQQNIDFVYTNTSVELNRLIKPNNPQIFIGEWATEWGTANLAHPSLSKKTIEDYKNFGKAQLQVYGKATFGWAYWTLKCPFSNLSFEWMIKNGYLQL